MTERALPRRPVALRLRTAVEARAAAPVLVVALMAGAFVARTLLGRYVLAPWEMVDELQYAAASRSFLSNGHYLFRDHPEALRTIYPALISPAWWASSTHTAYTLIKTINALLMTLGAIPLYLWARRLVAPLWAVLAVVLYLALPGFIYTGEILTENAYVPATILALFAMAAALERPTVGRQVLALAAIVLAAAARLQGLVLLIVLPTAIALVLLLDAVAAVPGERRRAVVAELRRFWLSLAAVAVAVVAYVGWELARGVSISSGLGMYQQVSSAHYAFRPALRWIAFHFGELSFAVGLLPVAALVVLFGLACRRATAPTPAERAFLAVTTAAVFWIVVQVGTFASHFSLRIEERYMLNVEPALLLALVVWLARGLPRPPGLTAAAVLVPVAFLLALPFESLFTEALFNDTYGLIPLWRLSNLLSGGTAEARALLGMGALVAGILFAGLPRRWGGVVVPAAVAAFLLVSSASVFAQVTFLSSATRHAGGLAGDPSWIDDTVGKSAHVELVDTADLTDPHVVWQAEFWNRSLRRLYGLTAQDPSIPDLAATVDLRGRVTAAGLGPGSPDANPRYVVSSPSLAVDGTRLTAAGQLVLWRVRQPFRLTSLVSGVTPDGWTGATASYLLFQPRGARHVTVSLGRTGLVGLTAAHVHATVASLSGKRWQQRTVTVPGGGTKLLRLPLRHGAFRVDLTVSPTFTPSQFGSPDTRTLGVRASFSAG